MSSNEEDYNDPDNPSSSSHSLKKRRIQRACDICRRKKIRCDGVQMPGNRCSNCIAYNFDCSYVEAAKKRGPPKGYVESLETRLDKLERLLRRLCPDDNLLRELDTTLDHANAASTSTSVFTSPQAPTPDGKDPHLAAATTAIRKLGESVYIDDDNAHLILADNLKQLSIDPVDYRFFGKSSGAMLIQTAIELKNEYTGSDHDHLKKATDALGSKREEFWSPNPWERSQSRYKRANYVFPDEDLIATLTELYFQNANLYLPLLHRPTFERLVAEGCHLNNDGFASTLLLVCAIGSRFSDDPRVLLPGEESLHSAGWKWFEQVQMVKKSLLAPPSLYDLQFYCLSVQFLQGSSAPQSCWTMVGIGIRLAQDVGAHRRKTRQGIPTVEDELWKRAFWVLVCMDRMVSAALGRPCAIQDEDFDLDMPIECDDEYWEHPDPEQRWKQPPGKPSLVASFNLYLRLNQVLAFSLRTIYSINKSKILLGFVGQQWEQHIVAELDSALNKWVDSVPDHLRWDPTRENEDFFNQSVVLYSAYYHIQILIHRPFIPSPSRPSPLSFPSLAICTNAARSCSHVVDVQLQRNPLPPPLVQMAVFTSGIVLLLSIWGGKRSGLSTDPNKEMADVHKCMKVLRTCERRWHSAGRLWDILYELASVGDLPLPLPSPPTTHKRERDGESSTTPPQIHDDSEMAHAGDGVRQIAGSKRVGNLTAQKHVSGPTGSSPVHMQNALVPSSQTLQVHGGLHSRPSSDNLTLVAAPGGQPEQQYFSLPMYSEDLGRLPLHGQIEFSSSARQAAMTQPTSAQSWPTQSGSSFNVNVNVNVGTSPPEAMASMRRASGSGMQGLPGMGGGVHGFECAPPAPGASSVGYGMVDGGAAFSGSAAGGDMAVGYGAAPGSAGPRGLGVPAQGRYPEGSMGPPPPHGAYQQQAKDVHGQVRYPGPSPGMGAALPGPQGITMRGPPVQGGQGGGRHTQNFVDSDTMAMWSNAPTGFELDEWGSYLMNVSELTQGGHPQPGPPE